HHQGGVVHGDVAPVQGVLEDVPARGVVQVHPGRQRTRKPGVLDPFAFVPEVAVAVDPDAALPGEPEGRGCFHGHQAWPWNRTASRGWGDLGRSWSNVGRNR